MARHSVSTTTSARTDRDVQEDGKDEIRPSILVDILVQLGVPSHFGDEPGEGEDSDGWEGNKT